MFPKRPPEEQVARKQLPGGGGVVHPPLPVYGMPAQMFRTTCPFQPSDIVRCRGSDYGLEKAELNFRDWKSAA